MSARVAGLADYGRLILRLDRVRLPIWAVSVVGLVLISASSITSLYRTPAQLASYARLARGNTAVIVQGGPGYGLDDPSQGAVLVNETLGWAAVLMALMGVFLVTRHTRGDEDNGRLELLLSGRTGRVAPLASTLAGIAALQLLCGAATAIGLMTTGFPAVGSWAFGAAMSGCGLVFTALAGGAAQVATTSRGANGIAGGLVAVAFIVRAVGDVGSGALSWLSPVGWAYAVRPFAGERWWVLLLPAALASVLVGVALRRAGRRDLGSGLFPQRPGPVEASPRLTGRWGLALRLQRSSLAWWSFGLMLLGFFYGVFAKEAEAIFEDNPDLEQFFRMAGQGSITDMFLATSLLMVSLLASGFVVSSVLRLHSEEDGRRCELLVSRAVTRAQWMGGWLAVTALGTVLVVGAGGLGVGAGHAIGSGRSGEVLRLSAAGLVGVAPLLVIGAGAAVIWAWLPRWSVAAWGLVAGIALVGLFAELLDLPDWVRGISPFHHVPARPVESFDPAAVGRLTLVAVALTAIAVWGFRRRDLA